MIIPLVCRHCGYDIINNPQYCLFPRTGALYCEAENLWIGYEFSDNLKDEQHKFYLELKAAHFHAAEVGGTVLAQTEDIVAVHEIFRMTVDHSKGVVRATTKRFTDNELAEYEAKNKDGAES